MVSLMNHKCLNLCVNKPFGFAAGAGILSGSTGLESMPGPQLPQMDFLNRWNGLILSISLTCILFGYHRST